MPRRKHPSTHTASKPERFFEKQLAGEEAPAFRTMETLFRYAGFLLNLAPWKIMGDNQLVMVHASTGQIAFCSVLGELGEVFAVQAFIGLDGYRLVTRIIDGEVTGAGELFAVQHSVSVEYVRLKDLKIADREMLAAMGHPLKHGSIAPVFRASRPGYCPWYVTESEAQLLSECIQSCIAVANYIRENGEAPFWDKEGSYPVVEAKERKGSGREFEIKISKPPRAPEVLPKMPVLDDARLHRILSKRLPVTGTLELDHFYEAIPIGQPNERKACLRMGLAIDSETGFAFPPRVESPSPSTGEILVDTLLKAIEASGKVPKAVHVRERDFKTLLGPLAKELGASVRVVEELPALDFAKTSLLEAFSR